MRIRTTLSYLFVVMRWTLIHLMVFAYCSYTAVDESYRDGWPDYAWLAKILSLPVSLSNTTRIPFILANSLLWGIGALLLKRISNHPGFRKMALGSAVLFLIGAFYSLGFKALVYFLGKDLPVVHRAGLLRNHPLVEIAGFPTVQLAEVTGGVPRLPLTLAVGLGIGALVLFLRATLLFRFRNPS